ncbi:hypothetical protein OAF61_00650 [Pseudomonadales bacterium]|nr:hypothetical protein [Pseudomonadales bacterium]
MAENLEIFDQGGTVKKLEPVKSWHMVTNQINLFYMIAAGMIMSPEGFGKKYYQDNVSIFPGYLPVFPNQVPIASVEYAVSEKSHLLPCILNLNLSDLSGLVKVITEAGEIRDVKFPDEVDASCQVMLVPAPLPIRYLNSIVCRSREDKVRCEKDVADFNNVDLTPYPIKTTAGAFKKLKSQVWPPVEGSVEPIDIDYAVPMAAGAIMGLLSNMSSFGDLAIETGKLAFSPEESVSELNSHPAIAALGEWLNVGGEIETSDISQKLFWQIVSRVAASKFSLDQASPIDVAIDYLETMSGDDFDEKTRNYGKGLAKDLRGILGLADSTISELFDRHPKPVSRAMTLFVLRENIEDLLEFVNPQLTEADYILAAILFAAREGWIGLTKEFRDLPGLNEAVSHRMADLSHKIAGSQLHLGVPPERPKSLLELVIPGGVPMSKAQKEAALYIARELKWDCIQTRINLGKGDYQLGVTTSGIQITLEGDAKAVVTEVLEDQFVDRFMSAELPEKVQAKVRVMLKAN